MIKNLVDCIEEKGNKTKENNYKKFYCVPHYLSCNLNSDLFEYISCKRGFVTPIFVNCDSISNGYRIIINSNSLILKDDIKIEQCSKTDIPLYAFDMLGTFSDISDKQKLCNTYAYYLQKIY